MQAKSTMVLPAVLMLKTENELSQCGTNPLNL
jgi:hypothetical protein